jgi:predicted nucleotidyltransferase
MNAAATRFLELNAVLVELAERAMAILGDNFVGAYLQGSFAVGDADLASDCDFLIPVHGPIQPTQEGALRALHREFPARDDYWAKRLEGSYPDKEELRMLAGLGKEWLYIDNGLSEMEWSTHCNTEVVRWSLRECGVTIIGPDPKTFVDEVSADVLRAKMRQEMAHFLPNLNAWTGIDRNAWSQRYAVTTLCRIMQTFDTGRITSKRAALLWGRDHLDGAWSDLIQRAIDDRKAQWDAPANPDDVKRTLAFLEFAQARLEV